jgi:lipopolysaccharide transport system permease protein
VLYVFCGLIPFLGFSEAITTGCPVLKQNLHLVKNVMLPIELIPIRGVLLGMTSQMVSLGVLLVMLAGHGDLGPGVVVLPVVVLLQVLFLAGAVLVLSTLTLLLPDVGYFVNLSVMLLMFVSPIGFKPEMIPTAWQWVLYINPIHYLTEAYRACLLADHAPSGPALSVYVVMCVGAFALGCEFFRRFRDVLVDFE